MAWYEACFLLHVCMWALAWKKRLLDALGQEWPTRGYQGPEVSDWLATPRALGNFLENCSGAILLVWTKYTPNGPTLLGRCF